MLTQMFRPLICTVILTTHTSFIHTAISFGEHNPGWILKNASGRSRSTQYDINTDDHQQPEVEFIENIQRRATTHGTGSTEKTLPSVGIKRYTFNYWGGHRAALGKDDLNEGFPAHMTSGSYSISSGGTTVNNERQQQRVLDVNSHTFSKLTHTSATIPNGLDDDIDDPNDRTVHLIPCDERDVPCKRHRTVHVIPCEERGVPCKRHRKGHKKKKKKSTTTKLSFKKRLLKFFHIIR